MLLTRTFNLSIDPNLSKLEELRYTSARFQKYVQHFCTQLFFREKSLSTKGMGQLANQAQHKSRGILNAQNESLKETGNKKSIPQISFQSCPGKIESSKESSFDYWIGFETQFSRNLVRVPAKSHKRLNHFLRQGWKLNPVCELVKQKNERFQARVYVQKELEKAAPKELSLGCDVGMTHMVSRSDGYLGASAIKILKKNRDRNSERRRQDHLKVSVKTELKQRLDIEARRAVNVSKRSEKSLVVENPKVLANLNPKLQWAKTYFAKRCHTLGQEEGVFVWEVNPAYTSQTCSRCGYRHKQSRVKSKFKCLGCGSSTHADINASRVIARKGSLSIAKAMQSGKLVPVGAPWEVGGDKFKEFFAK